MTSQRARNRLADRLAEEGIDDPAVLDAIRSTPRHIFIDEALAHRAYDDTPLPIGHGQTISQPYIVAAMTQALLAEREPRRVLEVGTGSGYQTAVLGALVEQVYSVERIAALQARARERLRALRLRNVRLRHADGALGWPEQSPFEAILVTAAPRSVPEELKQQLAHGGRMVLPVGGDAVQELVIVERGDGDEFSQRTLEFVRFVPLVSGTARE
ncbi:MAG: protein-L-isoaspartate(D-aspartate) O-methyltransferase [Pseudomonadales bacterium]